ncbi:MAG: acyltransferase family protein [Prevotella sp.]|nr:acyltransferase family protein [Prevotella sp.]
MTQQPQEKARLQWIDALRALAILLVVYGHHANTSFFSAFLNPVKMPLFFALSGYLFYIKPGGDKAFFKRTLYSLIIPWLCLGVVPLLFGIPFKGINHIMNSIIELLTGKELWFMPCFIIAQIIFYYTVKLSKNRVLPIVTCFMAYSAIGYVLRRNHILDIFMVNLAMMVQFYFLIGYLYRKYGKLLSGRLKYAGIVLMLCYIVLGIVFYPESRTDVHNALFRNLPVCTLMTTIGVVGLFMLSSTISNYPKWLLAVGKNSLVIYMLDKYMGIPIAFFYHFNDQLYIITFLATIIYLAYTSTMSIMIAKVLNKYIPWATGHRG